MKNTNKFVVIALCTTIIGIMSLPVSVNAETADSAQVISINATAPSKGKVIDCASLLTAQTETLRKLFGAEYYAETYPDVTAALGITDTKNLTEEQKTELFQHYMKYGINEGRKITDKISSNTVSELQTLSNDTQSVVSSSDINAQTTQSSSADDLPVGDLDQPIIVNADNLNNPYEGIWTPAGEDTVTIEEPWVSQPDKYPPITYYPEYPPITYYPEDE